MELLKEHLLERNEGYTSDTASLPKGILARVTYPIMRFGQKNANNRVYDRAVAERVLADEDVRMKLERRNLFGDCEHPDFTQVKLDPQKTSHLISKIYIDESENVLKADFDILKTMPGQFIYALLEAGSQVGVSTRAEGDLTEEVDESGTGKYYKVVPDSFKFSTTDFTGDASTKDVLPENLVKAVQKGFEAKLIDGKVALMLIEKIHTKESMALVESITKSEAKTLTEDKKTIEINSAADLYLKKQEITLSEAKNVKPGDIVVLKDGQRAIVNQVFERTGKVIVQAGLERKSALLSECKVLALKEITKENFADTTINQEVDEDYTEGNGSGMEAKKNDFETLAKTAIEPGDNAKRSVDWSNMASHDYTITYATPEGATRTELFQDRDEAFKRAAELGLTEDDVKLFKMREGKYDNWVECKDCKGNPKDDCDSCHGKGIVPPGFYESKSVNEAAYHVVKIGDKFAVVLNGVKNGTFNTNKEASDEIYRLEAKDKEKTESVSWIDEIKEEVLCMSNDVPNTGASDSEDQNAVPAQSDSDMAPADNAQDDTPVRGIDEYEDIDSMVHDAIKVNPDLANYDTEEVVKGLAEEIEEHYEDILENDLTKLAAIVCDHLRELPNYYTVTQEAINNAKDAQSNDGTSEEETADTYNDAPEPGQDEPKPVGNNNGLPESSEKSLKKRHDLHQLNIKLSDAQRQSDEEMVKHWKEEIEKLKAVKEGGEPSDDETPEKPQEQTDAMEEALEVVPGVEQDKDKINPSANSKLKDLKSDLTFKSGKVTEGNKNVKVIDKPTGQVIDTYKSKEKAQKSIEKDAAKGKIDTAEIKIKEAEQPGFKKDPDVTDREETPKHSEGTPNGDDGAGNNSAVGEMTKPGLYIVRHSSTSFNSADKSQDKVRGWKDVPLDQGGIDQAGKLAQAFSGLKVDKIVASDLSRCMDTAKIIGEAVGVTEITPVPDFRSWNMGDFQGKSSAESMPELEKFAKEKPDEKVPGGESFNTFAQRAVGALQKEVEAIKANPQATTIIVTHYRDIKLFQAWVQGGSKQDYSIDINTFMSDDVEPCTTFYLNTETEGMLNLDKVWELEKEQDGKNTFEAKANNIKTKKCPRCSGVGEDPATKKPCVKCDGHGMLESLNEDENIGDHLNIVANKLYKKSYAQCDDKEKEAIKLKSKAGSFPDMKESEDVTKFKSEIKNQVAEAIAKAEQESILESADEIVRKVQENYTKDIMDFTGKLAEAKKTEKDYENLKTVVENKNKEIEAFATQIKELTEAIDVKRQLHNKAVEQTNDKIAELNSLKESYEKNLTETKSLYERKIKEAQIKSMAKVTGLNLDDKTVTLLCECKSEDEIVTKIEEHRDKLARAMLHSGITGTITITETVPQREVVVGGIKMAGNLMDKVSIALDAIR